MSAGLLTNDVITWASIVLAAPALFMTSQLVTRYVLEALFPGEKVTITYTDSEGNQKKRTVYLDKDDDLLALYDELTTKKPQNGH